jgi:hypothetical protein
MRIPLYRNSSLERPIPIAFTISASVTDSNPCKILSKKLAESAPPRWRSVVEQMLLCIKTPSCTLSFLLGLQIGSLSGLALSRLIALLI